MNALGYPPTAQLRELTTAEVDEVSGGVLPLAVIAVAVLVAAAMQRSGEDSSSDSEESDDGGGDS